jgi:hypothetical protein
VNVIKIILKYSVPTSQKTHKVFVTKTNQLTLFREISELYSVSHMKHIITLYASDPEIFDVKKVANVATIAA